MSQPLPHLVRRGSGAPLLVLHGHGVDHRLLLPLDPALAGAGWERIHLDLPGFGQTSPLDAPGGLPELADWLDDVVGRLLGEARFAVLGISLGGLLARELAARRPGQVAGMALPAPVVRPDRERRRVPERVVLEGPLPEERFERFDSPALVVAGRQDHVVGFEDQLDLAARHLPRATVAVLDRAGHHVHLERPDVVAALVQAWSEDAARARRGGGPGDGDAARP